MKGCVIHGTFEPMTVEIKQTLHDANLGTYFLPCFALQHLQKLHHFDLCNTYPGFTECQINQNKRSTHFQAYLNLNRQYCLSMTGSKIIESMA